MISIRTKSSSSYIKEATQINLRVLHPLINMRQFSYTFLNSISIEFSDTICWSEDKRISDLEIEIL